jgi:hypothetical protein
MGLTGPRDNPPFPREETCFLPRFIFSFEFTQDGCPGIFSAVPGGTTPGLMYTQDLRPGLLSAVPCGAQTGTAVLTQTLKPLRYDFPTFERHSDNGISANLGQRK